MLAAAQLDRPAAPPCQFRAARRDDARRIAELFRIAADGVADYVWASLADQYPGLSPIEIGTARYARDGTAFSYQNCIVAERDGAVVGNCHAFVMEPSAPGGAIDPVLRPYAELEAPGSLYISCLAVDEGGRGCGIGSRLLELAAERARSEGAAALSLIVFEQNTGAKRLYQRSGFREVDRRPVVPHPLIHAEGDALLMLADL